MKTFELEGSVRTDLGRRATKALRTEGIIPSVLYGGEDMDTVHFTVPSPKVKGLIYTPDVFVIDLTIDGKTEKAILKEIQFHPVTDQILHMDFQRVFENVPTVMAIPVSLEGLAKGVKAGGRLILELRKLKIRAPYVNMPEKLTVDVTKLAIGDDIQVKELAFDGLEILNGPDAVVCRVRRTRVLVGPAAEDEEDEDEELEEGEEGEATEEKTEE